MNRVLKSLAGAIVASTLVFGATPALAHDDEIEVSPANGSQITRGISEVSVTFSEPVMQVPDNAGLIISITEPGGSTNNYQPACMRVNGNKLSVIASLETPGEHVVHWRSISSDGHPTEGSFSFTVQANGSHSWGGPMPVEECEVINDLIVMVTNTPTPVATSPAAADADFATKNLPGLLVGLGFILVASVLSALNIQRKQRKQTDRKYE